VTIARQVEAWYAERKDHLLRLFSKVGIASTEPDHPDGEIGIGFESPTIIAHVSIFNSGLITIPAVDKASRKEFVLEHRELAPDEDLAELLDRYVQQIASSR